MELWSTVRRIRPRWLWPVLLVAILVLAGTALAVTSESVPADPHSAGKDPALVAEPHADIRGQPAAEGLAVIRQVTRDASASGASRAEVDRHRAARQPPGPRPAPFWGATGDQGFLGEPESVILDKLLHGSVVGMKGSKAGRSVAFRLTFEDGTRGYYKPEQSFSAAHWYAEVVAYYLDRALGLGRVPPVVSRRLRWAGLEAAGRNHPRLHEVSVQPDGTVRGALVWWLPKRLMRLETPPGWENWVRVRSWPEWKPTPYQRPRRYGEQLASSGADEERSRRALYRGVPELDDPERAAELSDMIVFDYLTINVDRWGGYNVNVLTHGPGGPLIFLDNGAGFSPGPPRRTLMDDRLRATQRFRRKTIQALRALDVDKLVRKLERDRLAPLLGQSDIQGLKVRRQAVLDWVAALQTKFGDAVLAW